MLIEKLRARAWDPGRRFDEASVPRGWIAEQYGPDHEERIRADIRAWGTDGTIQLSSQTAEVAAFYADAPREPLSPPVTPAEVDEAERRIGRALPQLLRRIYTEVGNGGFGPDSGIVALTKGPQTPSHLTGRPSAVPAHEHHRAPGPPPSWLLLAYGGCSMEWHVSLAAVDNPVLL